MERFCPECGIIMHSVNTKWQGHCEYEFFKCEICKKLFRYLLRIYIKGIGDLPNENT